MTGWVYKEVARLKIGIGGGGGTDAVVSVTDYGPRGPGFETWPGLRSLWPLPSHIYPLFSTG